MIERERGGKKVWRTAQKSGSTSQNYYSIHVQPDLNSLDFSIYSASVGPSGTKNTVACLTLAHSVIVCARRAPSCFLSSFFPGCVDDEQDLPLETPLVVVEAPRVDDRWLTYLLQSTPPACRVQILHVGADLAEPVVCLLL